MVTSRLVPVVAGSLKNNVRISGCLVAHSVVPMGDTCLVTNNSATQSYAIQVKRIELDQTWTGGHPSPPGEGYSMGCGAMISTLALTAGRLATDFGAGYVCGETVSTHNLELKPSTNQRSTESHVLTLLLTSGASFDSQFYALNCDPVRLEFGLSISTVQRVVPFNQGVLRSRTEGCH